MCVLIYGRALLLRVLLSVIVVVRVAVVVVVMTRTMPHCPHLQVWFTDGAKYHNDSPESWVGSHAYGNNLVGLDIRLDGPHNYSLSEWQALNKTYDLGSRCVAEKRCEVLRLLFSSCVSMCLFSLCEARRWRPHNTVCLRLVWRAGCVALLDLHVLVVDVAYSYLNTSSMSQTKEIIAAARILLGM